jgi:hypothetical protein
MSGLGKKAASLPCERRLAAHQAAQDVPARLFAIFTGLGPALRRASTRGAAFLS